MNKLRLVLRHTDTMSHMLSITIHVDSYVSTLSYTGYVYNVCYWWYNFCQETDTQNNDLKDWNCFLPYLKVPAGIKVLLHRAVSGPHFSFVVSPLFHSWVLALNCMSKMDCQNFCILASMEKKDEWEDTLLSFNVTLWKFHTSVLLTFHWPQLSYMATADCKTGLEIWPSSRHHMPPSVIS